MTNLHIRPITDSELPLLERHLPFGDVNKHRRRLTQQRAGDVCYLIAWLGDSPVGHILIKWSGALEQPSLDGCPDLEDLFVAPSHRRHGIGLQLLMAAEHDARQRGYSRIGLGVGIENQPAQALYRQRGYDPYGESYTVRGNEQTTEEATHTWEEICIYLIKSL